MVLRAATPPPGRISTSCNNHGSTHVAIDQLVLLPQRLNQLWQGVQVHGRERFDTRREGFGLEASSRVIISKGRRLDDFQTGGKVDEEVLDLFLGSTGNLRAPCVRSGDTTLVGFNDEAWSQALL